MAVNMPLGKAFVEIGIRGSLERELARQREMLREFSATATRVFFAGTAAITGLVSAASPDAFNTVTGSIQLLAGEIGRAFIPAAVKAAIAIQKARNYIRGLSD